MDTLSAHTITNPKLLLVAATIFISALVSTGCSPSYDAPAETSDSEATPTPEDNAPYQKEKPSSEVTPVEDEVAPSIADEVLVFKAWNDPILYQKIVGSSWTKLQEKVGSTIDPNQRFEMIFAASCQLDDEDVTAASDVLVAETKTSNKQLAKATVQEILAQVPEFVFGQVPANTVGEPDPKWDASYDSLHEQSCR